MCNTEAGTKKIENDRKLLELEYIIRNSLKFVRCSVSRGKKIIFFRSLRMVGGKAQLLLQKDGKIVRGRVELQNLKASEKTVLVAHEGVQ